LDRARIEKGNFSSVDSKDQKDDIIAMANTETQEYTNNVSQQKNWQIEEECLTDFGFYLASLLLFII
jgi:hypothetical protein